MVRIKLSVCSHALLVGPDVRETQQRIRADAAKDPALLQHRSVEPMHPT